MQANGDYDLGYFAPDCFHFSQQGHAAAAMTLWNTMVCIFGFKNVQLSMIV